MMLFLDALDQLSDAVEPGALSWLPKELPAYVSLVFSCLSFLEPQLSDATPYPLDQMPAKEAGAILDAWFVSRDCRRKLKKEQRDAILAGFAHTGLPIYLRLAFEAAKKWHAYAPAPTLPDDVSGMLGRFFAELERQHTQITVSKAIGYMLSGRYSGLTEKEILDMLVFDEEHWQAFLARTHKDHVEEVREGNTLPVVVWSRIVPGSETVFDRAQYARGADCVLLSPPVCRVCQRRRYCGNVGGHWLQKNLARYFADLPLFVDGDQRKLPNVRKCIEQPWQQTRGKMWACNRDALRDFFCGGPGKGRTT